MLRENSIKARLCGHCFIPTIIKFNESLTNSGDVIAMKHHIRGITFGRICNLSVATFPINALIDCVAHLLFNDTHGRKVWWGWCGDLSTTSIEYRILSAVPKPCARNPTGTRYKEPQERPRRKATSSCSKNTSAMSFSRESVREMSNFSQTKSTAKSRSALS